MLVVVFEDADEDLDEAADVVDCLNFCFATEAIGDVNVEETDASPASDVIEVLYDGERDEVASELVELLLWEWCKYSCCAA